MTSPSEEFVIRKRKVLLDNAAELDAEGISFTHLRVSDSSDATANVQIIFANLDNPGVTLKRGIRLENFSIRSGKVWFTNTAQPGKFVEIEYWGGPPVGPPRIVNEGLIIDVVQPDFNLSVVGTATLAVAGAQLILLVTAGQTWRVGHVVMGSVAGLLSAHTDRYLLFDGTNTIDLITEQPNSGVTVFATGFSASFSPPLTLTAGQGFVIERKVVGALTGSTILIHYRV